MEAAVIGGAATIVVALIGLISATITNRKKTEEAVKAAVKDEMRTANAETNKRISAVQDALDAHIAESGVEKAKNQRQQILRFYDEICAGRKHSEAVFENIIDDIDEYEEYCRTHPGFKNSRGQLAMKHIRDTYDTLKSGGKFEIKE